MCYQDGYKDKKWCELFKVVGVVVKKKGFVVIGVDVLVEVVGVMLGFVYVYFGFKVGLLDVVIVNEMEWSCV